MVKGTSYSLYPLLLTRSQELAFHKGRGLMAGLVRFYSSKPELANVDYTKPIPVKIYNNSDVDKNSIIKENYKVSGIYR